MKDHVPQNSVDSLTFKTKVGSSVCGYLYGDPDGEPMIYCHGWPGSGVQAALADSAAQKHGFRIFSPDRPGIGGSSYVPDRQISDWPDLAIQAAETLGWKSFHLLAVSGGCPYVLAIAAAYPERVRSVTICCGAALPEFVLDPKNSYPIYRGLEILHRRLPVALRAGLHLARLYLKMIPAGFVFYPLYPFIDANERRAIHPRKNRLPMARSVKGGFRQHPRGILHDATRFIEPWGFSLESIQIPVHFWHGTADRNIPIEAARKTAAKVPNSSFTEVSGESHYSLPLLYLDKIVGGISAEKSS